MAFMKAADVTELAMELELGMEVIMEREFTVKVLEI